MCFGSKSNTDIPPPKPPTTFDYNAGQRSDATNQQKVAAITSSTTPNASFGSELGNATAGGK